MNIKFNLGEINVNLEENDVVPAGDITIKEISYEVTDLSLSEYGSVLKSLLTEGLSAVKEINVLQEQSKEADFKRDIQLIEARRTLSDSIKQMEEESSKLATV